MPGKELKAVSPRPGQPLYISARDTVREAIDAGLFAPGEQMPSTKELSEKLEVSLVTAHRALQELVNAGVLQRSQGKGTFVHEQYLDRKDTLAGTRVGLFLHADASLSDYYHSQVLEGVRQAAQRAGADLILLRFGEDMRNECSGYLYFNPMPEELDVLAGSGGSARRKQPTIAVGAKARSAGAGIRRLNSIDIDDIDLARQAVEHLADQGHTAIGYVGPDDQLTSSIDRWEGFAHTCERRAGSGKPRAQHVIKTSGWRMSSADRAALTRMLSTADRPTSIFAGGFFFALDVYAAAAAARLRIPDELSVIAVDDPPSAEFLAPPLTTFRQPLVQLGSEAFDVLAAQIQQKSEEVVSRTLKAELIMRRSTAPALAGVEAR